MRWVRRGGRLLLRFYPTDWCKYQELLFSDDGCESSEQPDDHTRKCKKRMCFVGGHTVLEAALGSCRMQETSTTMLHRWHRRDFQAQWRARIYVHVSVGNAPFHFRLVQVGLCRAMQ